MSKRTTTRWFIWAWIVALLSGTAIGLMGQTPAGGGISLGVSVAYLVALACVLVMFVMWINALVRLGQRRAWGWFVSMLLFYALTLGVLGIIPMLAYAMAGPDGVEEVALRPTMT